MRKDGPVVWALAEGGPGGLPDSCLLFLQLLSALPLTCCLQPPLLQKGTPLRRTAGTGTAPAQQLWEHHLLMSCSQGGPCQ